MPRTSQCPSESCGDAYPAQVRVSKIELEAVGLHEAWIADAERCTYCNCVYSRDGRRKRVHGYLQLNRWVPADA